MACIDHICTKPSCPGIVIDNDPTTIPCPVCGAPMIAINSDD